MNRNKRLRWLSVITLTVLLAAVSLCVGSSGIGPREIINWKLGNGDPMTGVILEYLRIPRILAGTLAGIGLGLSGFLLQKATGNPLAGPNITGVNAGAGFAVTLGLLLLPGAYGLTSAFAFGGAVLSVFLVLAVSKSAGGGKNTILLTGVACTSLFQAFISLLTNLDSDLLIQYNAFTVGSLNGVSTERLLVPAIVIICCLTVTVIEHRKIGMLALGDELAASFGIHVSRARRICLILSAACAASVVSFAGMLGFVGLMVPNIAVRLTGEKILPSLAMSLLLGVLLVLGADLAGRMLFAPAEIAAGVMLAIIGAPFLFTLLIHEREKADA